MCGRGAPFVAIPVAGEGGSAAYTIALPEKASASSLVTVSRVS
jgi:hypothetical protein